MNTRKMVLKVIKNRFKNFWWNRCWITLRTKIWDLINEEIEIFLQYWYYKDRWCFEQDWFLYIIYYEKVKYAKDMVKSMLWLDWCAWNGKRKQDILKRIDYKIIPKIVWCRRNDIDEFILINN